MRFDLQKYVNGRGGIRRKERYAARKEQRSKDRVRSGMHAKTPDLYFCRSGACSGVPPAGFEPAHTAPEFLGKQQEQALGDGGEAEGTAGMGEPDGARAEAGQAEHDGRRREAAGERDAGGRRGAGGRCR
ncbi:hypothetical protein GCM10010307_17970 [Streptomyces vastus]|uniref:Uncharacterized protein n=1 Tax=Streptomyces vastus TaxID=285451 RepID=A0ABP6CX57_9ACTN